MPRNLKIALAILIVAVIAGLISLRSLHRRIRGLSGTQASEEQERREVLAPPITTPTDVMSEAKIFWAAGPDKIAPVVVDLPLSADPVQRSRQVIRELIANPPTPDQRTLPADATLLSFYILPSGTAIADFSDALTSETPSGILSESMAVNSIAQTLANNVPSLRRLKILIHGQEVETLAGHVDLTGFFDLNIATQAPGPLAPSPSTPAPSGAAAPQTPNAAPAAPANPAH